MKSLVPLVLLPYALSVISKLASIFWDRPLMTKALRALAFSPRPQGASGLDSGQQAVIIRHISLEQLKSATILTTFTSSFAGFLVFYDVKDVPWAPWILWVLLLLGAGLLFWIYPKGVDYFSEKGLLGIDRDLMVTILSCGYDVFMGGLSVLAVYHKSALST
jgi:hypothetical protein